MAFGWSSRVSLLPEVLLLPLWPTPSESFLPLYQVIVSLERALSQCRSQKNRRVPSLLLRFKIVQMLLPLLVLVLRMLLVLLLSLFATAIDTQRSPWIVPCLPHDEPRDPSHNHSMRTSIIANEHQLRYEYTRSFENPQTLLPQTYIIIRLDGRSFHKLSTKYTFSKPNDPRALNLMNTSAIYVLQQLPDILLAYGQSDEMSFVLGPQCQLYERRSDKLVSTIVSLFTGVYCLHWSQYFPTIDLTPPFPSFDGRAVCYPTLKTLRDYLSWRQVDCHINNLYNTTFWALVEKGGMGRREAEEALKGTVAAEKNEILWRRFGVNYNGLAAVERKGSVIFRGVEVIERKKGGMAVGSCAADEGDGAEGEAGDEAEGYGEEGGQASVEPLYAQGNDLLSSNVPMNRKGRPPDSKIKWKSTISIGHEDIIKDAFWKAHPWILESGTARKRAIKAFLASDAANDRLEKNEVQNS